MKKELQCRHLCAGLLAGGLLAGMLAACGAPGGNAADKNGSDTNAETTREAAVSDVGEEEGAAEDAWAEHLEFTVLSLDYPDGFDTMPLLQEAKEKFNVDFTVQQVAWDSWDETVRTLAASDSLPEVIAWYNVIYGEYKNYAEQGVLRAIPNDLSRWSNLQKYAEQMAVFEGLRLDDGSLYCFPKYNPNQPFNHHRNQQVIYRRDWAEEMGYDFAPVQEITWDELVDYLRDLKAKDPGGLGDKLVPMDYYSGGHTWPDAVGMFNKYVTSYYKKDGAYVWGGRDEATLEGILALKTLYDEGLLYADSYADVTSAGSDRFSAGRSGVWYGDFALSALVDGFATRLPQSVPGFEDEDLGTFLVTMPDGYIHSSEYDGWWAAFAFNGSCSDEIMERVMDMGNWLLEEEQIEKYAYGVEGEDWTKAEDGSIELNWTSEQTVAGGEKEYIIQQRMFQKWFILEGLDKWLDNNPAKRDYLQEEVFHGYYDQLQKAEEEGRVKFYPVDYEVGFVSTPSYDMYNNFSSDVEAAIIEAVVSPDAQASWQKFLDTNAGKIDAVLEELNEKLSGN